MEFLDIRIDIIFKKFFASPGQEGIIINFLNALLGRQDQEKFNSLVIKSPYTYPEDCQYKYLERDFHKATFACTDMSGKDYLIELQMDLFKYRFKMGPYCASAALSNELEKYESEGKKATIIFIGISNFNRFEDETYSAYRKISDSKIAPKALTHQASCYFIELNKFHKKLDAIDSGHDAWIYFLNDITDHRKVPAELKKYEGIQPACYFLDNGEWTNRELWAYEKINDIQRSEDCIIETALEEYQKSCLKLIALDKELNPHSIAKQLLIDDRLNEQQISGFTGLTIEEIKSLKEQE